MKKQIAFCVIVLLIGISSLKAQTNIGDRNPPDASSQLQISSTTKGVMMPKVTLTTTANFTLAGNTQTAGMVVYNTNASIAGTTAYPAYGTGLYAWDGTGWKGMPVGNLVTANNGLTATNGNVQLGGALTTPTTTITTFGTTKTLAIAGLQIGASTDAI